MVDDIAMDARYHPIDEAVDEASFGLLILAMQRIGDRRQTLLFSHLCTVASCDFIRRLLRKVKQVAGG